MPKQKYLKILLPVALFTLGISTSAFALQDTDAPPSLNIAIPSACTENTTTENNSKLCQNGSYVTCDAAKEGTKSKNGAKVCKNGKWVDTPTNPTPPADDSDAPPSLSIKIDAPENPDPPKNPDPPASGGSIKITKADAYPKGFNPTVGESKISYEVNKDAVIEIKITDSNNLNVAKLVENKKITAGEYFVNWKGTSNNEQNGTILAPGTYKYKILAKDPVTSEVKDTAEGEINLIYSAPKTEGPGTELPVEIDKQQAKATQTLNNSTSGTTAKTGPGVLIYAIFPLAGYLITRRRRQSPSEPKGEQSERSENH